MFVPSTCWSIPVMSLLLVMSTLQPLLLSTAQASVVPGIVRQMLQPSMDSNLSTTKDRSTLATGLLGQSSLGISPDAQKCIDSVHKDKNAMAVFKLCTQYQSVWIDLLHDPKAIEYQCKGLYLDYYCCNLVANTYCKPDQYAVYRKALQSDFDANAALCKRWASWLPPMESPPPVTSESIKCAETLSDKEDVVKCGDEAVKNITNGNIVEPIEALCKIIFVVEKCQIEGACKYCHAANKYLSFYANFWSPKKVECTKWSGDEPKLQCPTNVLLIVGIIIAVIAILAVIGVVVYCVCFSSDDGGGSHGGSSRPSALNPRQQGSSLGRA